MSEWTEKDFESYTQSDWELIKAVKQLTDENLDDVKILTRANDIALAIFGMLCVRLRDNGEEGADGLGMSLQEYTVTVLANAIKERKMTAGPLNSLSRLTNLLNTAKRSLVNKP